MQEWTNLNLKCCSCCFTQCKKCLFFCGLASMLYFNGNQSVLRFVGFRCQAIHTDLMFSHINDHRPKLLVFCQNGLSLSPDPEQCQRRPFTHKSPATHCHHHHHHCQRWVRGTFYPRRRIVVNSWLMLLELREQTELDKLFSSSSVTQSCWR